jgi:hypothetical protein
MRLESTPEMKELFAVFDPYIKRNSNGDYMPDDAPEEAKKAFEKWLILGKKQYDEEVSSWWN